MKFSCYKDDLADALKAVMPAVAVKAQTPVLAGVYIKAENSMFELQANNYTQGVIAKIPCSTEESGEVVVGFKKFQEFVSKIATKTLTCSAENNSLTVDAGGATVNLLTMDAADFPKVKAVDGTSSKIKSRDLYNLIRQTVFAADYSKTARSIFAGALFEFKDNTLTVVASNTHRLATVNATLQIDAEPFAFVVPAASLNAVLSRIDTKDADNFVTVTFAGRYVAFTYDNVFMTARLLEGQYPPYERIFPTGSTTRVTINAAAFQKAIDIVGVVAKESQYGTIMLCFADGHCNLQAKSQDIGSAEQTVECTIDGADIDIAFNYAYWADALRVIDAHEINIAFNDKYSPALVTIPGNDDFRYVITPVRT